MKKYLQLGKKIFNIHRSITGKGTLRTLKILKKKNNNLKIKHFITNKKVFDWKIPSEWNIKDAYVSDFKGNKIIDFRKNNLHIVAYSKSIDKQISKSELLKHLHYLRSQPRAIPYVTSYYNKYWGFCVSFKEYKKIKNTYKNNSKFYVKVDSSFKSQGKMHYGEVFLKGKSQEEILLSTYICHPSMANNELSGPLIALALSNYYKNKNLKKSIRILFLPETIGAIAYIAKNLKNLKSKVIGGYVLSCIGDERNYSYIRSKYPNSASDICAFASFDKLKIKYKNYNFLKSESDERRFNSPFVDLGIGSLLRTKYHSYPEYHTSLDDFNVVTKSGLEGGFNISKNCVNNLLNYNVKKNKFKFKLKIKKNCPITKFICEPNLGKRNLYPKISKKDNNFKDPHILLDFLQYADGTNSLSKIAEHIKSNIYKVRKINNLLLKNSIIFYKND